MKQFIPLMILGLALGVVSCKNKVSSNQSAQAANDSSVSELMELASPNIPVIYNNVEDRGTFLVKNYWTNFDMSNTYNQELLEQKWVDYIDLIPRFASDNYTEVLKSFYLMLQSNATYYQFFTDLADKYLFDTGSAMRNDMLYVPILEVMLSKEGLSDIEVEQLSFKLKMSSKNNPGSVAQDFSYTKLDGTQSRLSKSKKELTLIFFFDPGCNICLHNAETLANSAEINSLIKDNELDILTICVEEGIEEWKKHVVNWPKDWIKGYDTNQAIINETLYDLRAIPSFYLIDKDGKVFLKDRPIEEIINLLS